jgi:L-alanine-DL-glutamate epimerase-like enolase superfamily enzyme
LQVAKASTIDATARLTIRDIELIPILAPLQHEYRGSYYRMANRATVIIRIRTDEGLVGEAYAGDEDETLAQIVDIVRDEITPRVIGQDALAVERCWQLAFPVTFDQLRDRKVGLVALALLDHALWDLVGKASGLPLWRLWGGYRERMPVNIIGGYYGRDLGGIRDEVSEWVDMGFRGCKFKIGRLDPDEDAARVRVVRETAGPDFVITVDANQGYSLASALEVSDKIRELGIRWFEEPCQWRSDKRSLREVRARSGIATCAGQSEQSAAGCRDLFDCGAVDVCNFDASWSGGCTEWHRMAAVAHTYEVQVGHHEEPHVSVHLLASQPHSTYAEVFHPDRDPLWWNLVVNRPELEDGMMKLPEAPGFGWDLDESYINRYRVDRD